MTSSQLDAVWILPHSQSSEKSDSHSFHLKIVAYHKLVTLTFVGPFHGLAGSVVGHISIAAEFKYQPGCFIVHIVS